jgi:hypothetical protein
MEKCVLRGASFNNNSQNVGCAYRNTNNGFRVLLSRI